jgi:hypothetical protein
MKRIGWEKRADRLRQTLALIKSRARVDSTRFQELGRQAECCKVQFLALQLEVRRVSLARGRGLASAARSGKGPAALGFAAAASIITGVMTKDESTSTNVGISSLNKALQRLGETDWAVCLGDNLAISPQANITPGKVWFTYDSVRKALCELEQRANNGVVLGNLDAIISELQKDHNLIQIINTRIRINRAIK